MNAPELFLWGGRFDCPTVDPAAPDGEWWRQYVERLNLTPNALAELAESTRRLAALLPAAPAPVTSGPVRGVVVGSVQSGKTAHMIGLTARVLDKGYHCVVVLAGLKDDLRAQTARRFNTQLLRQRDSLASGKGFTLSRDQERRRVSALAPPYSVDCHQWALFHLRLTQAVDAGVPVVAVIKKNRASLSTMRERLRQACSRRPPGSFRILILDDECDEASVEPGVDAPTPEMIANLWKQGDDVPHVAYVGYTATPAANLLQKLDNDLYPSDFVYLLRSPGSEDGPLTYREPVPHGWYTGGEAFYERFVRPQDGGSSLLVEPSVTSQDLASDPLHNESLKQAIRAFLLGAAYRSLEHPDLSYENASRLPKPHTMIVQASASISEHEKWAKAICMFLGMATTNAMVSAAALQADLDEQDSAWAAAVASFEQSRIAVSELQPHPWPLRLFDWKELRLAVLALAPYVKVRVLNSGPGAIDSLDFEGSSGPGGDLLIPEDLLSIIVGGSRLSRGLTIDGLSISYFSRRAETPTEDSVLQLSRWYGYRSSHIDYCRIITTPELARELFWIHSHDLELRLKLAQLISDRSSPRDAGLVLASVPHGLPTAKLGQGLLRDVSFSPWCRVIGFAELGQQEASNEDLARSVIDAISSNGPELVRTGNGATRGVVSRGWSIDQIISILERWSFSGHNPDETQALLADVYRVHDRSRAVGSSFPEYMDPYAVAAYLRKWQTWALREQEPVPVFNVGVAYGSEGRQAAPFTIPLTNREISSSGFVNGEWVGRGDAWPGDQFFDGVAPELVMPNSAKRRLGAPGLLLMYVIHKEAKGRRGRGVTRAHHTPVFGLSIPDGGPTFRRVQIARSSATA